MTCCQWDRVRFRHRCAYALHIRWLFVMYKSFPWGLRGRLRIVTSLLLVDLRPAHSPYKFHIVAIKERAPLYFLSDPEECSLFSFSIRCLWTFLMPNYQSVMILVDAIDHGMCHTNTCSNCSMSHAPTSQHKDLIYRSDRGRMGHDLIYWIGNDNGEWRQKLGIKCQIQTHCEGPR